MPNTSKKLASIYTDEFLCARIFERHRERIKVRKKHLVVANLSSIVKAFLHLSNRKGFHATSLRDLADESGMSMGGLYSYFDSKETLLLMVLEEVVATVNEVFSKAPSNVTSDPREHLLWVIETHIQLTEVMLPWFVFAFMEAKSFPASARHAATDSEIYTEDIIADIIERGAGQGLFRTTDARFAAALMKPLLQDWYVKRSKYRKRNVDSDRYINEVQFFVLKSLGCSLPIRLASKMARSEADSSRL